MSERLEFETAVLAGRLAQVLADSLASDPHAAEGIAFLRSASEAAASRPRPAAAPEEPLGRLARAFSLSATDVELLLLAGMAEEHEGYAAVFASLNPEGEARPTAGLAARLLCPGAVERRELRIALESGPLVASGAVKLAGNGPFFNRSLVPADALWPALHGIDAWPSSTIRLHTMAASHGLDEWLASPDAALALRALESNERAVVLVTAENEEIASDRALALVARSGRNAAAVALPVASDTQQVKLVWLHAALRGAVPLLRVTAPEPPLVPEPLTVSGCPGPVVICTKPGAVPIRGTHPLLPVSVERLSPCARREMWRSALPELSAYSTFLAARYTIEPTLAEEVAGDLRCRKALSGAPVGLEHLGGGLRARAGVSLSAGLKLIRPVATWDELILPADRIDQLREAAGRLTLQAQVLDDWGFLRNRHGARGVRMLFAGPPGTGKTLSAEVLARDLKVDLLVADISRVVSKWIGETEKNLAAVFDTAERAQAALFFDEADALFGKRTEVTDAHDRYANLETAYLLARLERFEGLAILASNLRKNIDQAFIRRLEAVVEFHEPDREERYRLWRCHIPNDVPLDEDVNLYELAALYPVVGGFIRNAAVSAAYLAAADGLPLSRIHFFRAIRREYEKAGKAFPGVPAGVGRI